MGCCNHSSEWWLCVVCYWQGACREFAWVKLLRRPEKIVTMRDAYMIQFVLNSPVPRVRLTCFKSRACNLQAKPLFSTLFRCILAWVSATKFAVSVYLALIRGVTSLKIYIYL